MIPAGTKIYRTTASTEANADGATYVSYLDSDRNHYKGGWIRAQGNTGKAYEHSFELKEDLKVPSRAELQSVIYSTVNKNKDNIQKTVKAWVDVAFPEGSMSQYYAFYDQVTDTFDKKKYQNFVNDAIKEFGNKTVQEAYFYTAQTFGKNETVRSLVINELKSRGYNAMVDEASVGGQNGFGREGSDPLIIFDGSKSLAKTSTKEITSKEEAKAAKKFEKWLRKADRNTGSWSGL